MKKKRLLAVFAAFAVAASMAIGFSACKDEDKGGVVLTADDSVQTKEQWVAAFKSALSSKNYSINSVNKEKVLDSYEEYDKPEPAFHIESERKRELKVDRENGLELYAEERYTSASSNDIDGIQVEYHNIEGFEAYVELVDTDLLRYGNNYSSYFGYGYFWDGENYELGDFNKEETNDWKQSSESLSWVADLNDYLDNWIIMSVNGWLSFLDYFTELFDSFTYDAETYTYTITDFMSYDKLEISFCKGKVFKVTGDYGKRRIDMDSVDPYRLGHDEITYSFGGISATVPEEVKKAAEENKE